MGIKKINFPAGETTETLYLGRNSVGKCCGLVLRSTSKVATLAPINSKGLMARCYIDVPTDPSTLRGIGEFFAGLANQVERDRAGRG